MTCVLCGARRWFGYLRHRQTCTHYRAGPDVRLTNPDRALSAHPDLVDLAANVDYWYPALTSGFKERAVDLNRPPPDARSLKSRRSGL